MIDPRVRQTVGTGSPRAYAASMAGLWIDLELTLARLDSFAADPERLVEDRETLPALQYELHCAAELVTGLTPPAEVALVHEELGESLAEARELTAEMAEAVAHGGLDAAAPLVWEWRGALFRVRFARRRLERPRSVLVPMPEQGQSSGRRAPLFAGLAVGVGSALVLVAALLGLWVLVAFTLAGTVAASVLLRP